MSKKILLNSVLIARVSLVAVAALQLVSNVALGQDAPPPVAPGGTADVPAAVATASQPSMLGAMAPMLILFAVMIFFVILPQRKRTKQQAALIGALKVGDEVLLASGILGKISRIDDKIVHVEVSESVKIRVVKSQVTQVIANGVVPA